MRGGYSQPAVSIPEFRDIEHHRISGLVTSNRRPEMLLARNNTTTWSLVFDREDAALFVERTVNGKNLRYVAVVLAEVETMFSP